MTSINTEILLAALLLLLGIASSKFSARLGMPVLLLFLAVGMLAGSEGLGRIPFEDYGLANAVGSVALALILFDGGLRTSIEAVRASWRPALALSTVGVLVTSGITGLVAAVVLGLPLLHGMLLGCIVGSTDAAAVLSVLRSSGLRLPEKLSATLEVESGSNDPMAIFLTLGLVGFITGEATSAGQLVLLFILQLSVGAAVGIGVGRGAAWLTNRINLDAPGLYPLLVLSFGLLAFSLASELQGSGFLAVYIAGITLGNSSLVFRRGICLFHDTVAWFGQIVLFVMLGLLSFPSRLAAVAVDGLLIALALVFVARPLAVASLLAPFKFRLRELAFLSWGGLKGAVPITLATFPLLAGVAQSSLLFDVVFFVVLVSALVQGWSLPVVAKRLGIGEPADPAPPVSVEVHSLRHLDGDIVRYTVTPSAPVAGKVLRELALPNGVAITLVVRNGEIIIPRGRTVLHPGDHAFVAQQTLLQPLVERLFSGKTARPPMASGCTFTVDAQSTVGQLHHLLGLPTTSDSDQPIGATLEKTGGTMRLGPFLATLGGSPEWVTLVFETETEITTADAGSRTKMTK